MVVLALSSAWCQDRFHDCVSLTVQMQAHAESSMAIDSFRTRIAHLYLFAAMKPNQIEPNKTEIKKVDLCWGEWQ